MRTFCILLILIVATWINAQEVERFMVISDVHHYSPSPDFSQSMLYEITLAAINEKVDFIFFTGDMIIRGFGSPSEEDSVLKDWRFVLDTLHHHNIKVFACRGNGDISSREAWDSLFSGEYLFPQNGPENEKNITYAIEYDNLLFIALDLYTEYHKVNQAWLDELLATTSKKNIFAAGHESAFKLSMPNCMGAYPEDRNLFWESLTDAGAKAYFCGHDHFYDHAIIDDGDGNSFNNVHQVIVGTGGNSFFSDSEYDGDNGRWTPSRLFHEGTNGYVLVEINDTGVQMKWKHRIEWCVFEDGGDSYAFSSTGMGPERKPSPDLNLWNAPNPFHGATVIGYSLPSAGNVELSVFNLYGQKIESLTDEKQQPGEHSVTWKAEGQKAGIYYIQLKTNRGVELTKKLVLAE
jgi:predicted phosphodiesterase